MPPLSYHFVSKALNRCETTAMMSNLTKAPWYMVHDFSGLKDFETIAFTAFPHFARWACQNNRIVTVIILPQDKDGAIERFKELNTFVMRLISRFVHVSDETHIQADDVKDAFHKLQQIKAKQ